MARALRTGVTPELRRPPPRRRGRRHYHSYSAQKRRRLPLSLPPPPLSLLQDFIQERSEFLDKVNSKSGLDPNGTFLPPAVNPTCSLDYKVTA